MKVSSSAAAIVPPGAPLSVKVVPAIVDTVTLFEMFVLVTVWPALILWLALERFTVVEFDVEDPFAWVVLMFFCLTLG